MALDLILPGLLQPHDLLYRVIETPRLIAAVQALDPRALARLIDLVGLEDAGEIISLATTDQIAHLLDDDLWKSGQPGVDESFDPARFALWLEVMLEAGEAFVAQKLTELPEELVFFAFFEHILVLDTDELAAQMMDRNQDADLTDKALTSCLYHEFDQYQVISKRTDGWDAILTALIALDEQHSHFFQRLLARCCHASTELIEENGGLYQVLTSAEMLASDAAAERQDRRACKGFVAPSDAAAFLRLALVSDLQEIIASNERDPITHAYFRDLENAPEKSPRRAVSPIAFGPGQWEKTAPAHRLLDAINRASADQSPEPMRALGGDSSAVPWNADVLLVRALEALSKEDPHAYSARMTELAYLANALISGCSFEGRAFRPFEAVEAAVAVSNFGLAHLLKNTASQGPRRHPDQRAAEVLAGCGADKLFRVGFNLVHKTDPGSDRSGSTPSLTRDQIHAARKMTDSSDLDL